MPDNHRLAFTLIELLVVMAIIGTLAGLIVHLAAGASAKGKLKRVEAEKEKLISMIDAYHEKLGWYPPDSGIVNKSDPDRAWTSTNLLFYELIGATFDAPNTRFVAMDTNIVTADQFKNVYNVGGVRNSIESRNFFVTPPKTTDYAPVAIPVDGVAILQLIVPVPLVTTNTFANTRPNFWHYDSSSTNRHHPESYDLWAVFSSGKNIITNDNWSNN